METIEYDSKFQLQAKEDAVKYKQKLFAEELFSQSLQIQSLQSENKILKATIEEDKDVLKENLGYIEELLDEKKSWDKKDRDAEAEAKIKKLQQSIVTKDTQFEEHKKELIAKYESLIRRSSAEFEENERSLLATHERQISSILGEKNEKQDKILQEKLQECKADVLKETNKVIQKEKELVNLKDRMEAEIKTEKEKEKSKSLDQKFRISETEHMKNKARLSQNLNENKVLKGRVADLHSKLRGCQPLLIKGRVKTQDMETYIMRCKEDIQAVADITDPKKLIIGVAHLKAQHVDGDDRVPMEENTRTGYRHMVDGLMHQVKGLARVHTADAKLVERTRDEVNCFNQRKINLCVEKTNIINETTHEVLALKAKLRLTEKNLEKATDTTPKRVDSWLDEKYLRKTRTVSEETMFSEETLGHFPRVKRINEGNCHIKLHCGRLQELANMVHMVKNVIPYNCANEEAEEQIYLRHVCGEVMRRMDLHVAQDVMRRMHLHVAQDVMRRMDLQHLALLAQST
ncbi:hypothetical protein NQZ68_008848 [Dissostichus eleginoides]|nr:hypothetical protein NQZ68_008848 [Dissostichus eleginoides]